MIKWTPTTTHFKYVLNGTPNSRYTLPAMVYQYIGLAGTAYNL